MHFVDFTVSFIHFWPQTISEDLLTHTVLFLSHLFLFYSLKSYFLSFSLTLISIMPNPKATPPQWSVDLHSRTSDHFVYFHLSLYNYIIMPNPKASGHLAAHSFRLPEPEQEIDKKKILKLLKNKINLENLKTWRLDMTIK